MSLNNIKIQQEKMDLFRTPSVPFYLSLLKKKRILRKCQLDILFSYISLINVMNQIELCVYICQSNIGSCYFLKKHTKSCFEKRSGQVIWDKFFFQSGHVKRDGGSMYYLRSLLFLYLIRFQGQSNYPHSPVFTVLMFRFQSKSNVPA